MNFIGSNIPTMNNLQQVILAAKRELNQIRALRALQWASKKDTIAEKLLEAIVEHAKEHYSDKLEEYKNSRIF